MSSNTQTPKQKFLTRLAVLAELCGKDLSMDTVALYDRLLFPAYQYDDLATALEKIIANRGDRDAFPSVKTISDQINPTVDDEALAAEAATRLVGSIARFGYVDPRGAREYMGEVAWAIVEREGGWTSLCERVTTNQLPSLKAQWRELAKALMTKARAGKLDQAPALPTRHDGRAAAAGELTSGIGKCLPT
jgi:hypothetical protein